jgi:hypothetical protein
LVGLTPATRVGPKATKQAFQWDDPLSLEGQITADERAVRDTAHVYCQEQSSVRRQLRSQTRGSEREDANPARGLHHGRLEQRLRDVLGFQIGDGTAQIMKTIIARARASALPSRLSSWQRACNSS